MSNDEETVGRSSAYVESPIIMTTVRVVVPFSVTYGLFLVFHGADSPGGSFQGGAIIGASVLMIAFAFGVEPTRDWLRNRTIVALAAGGVVGFTAVGLLPVLRGGAFLQHALLESFGIEMKYGLEGIEIFGVAPIVSGDRCWLVFRYRRRARRPLRSATVCTSTPGGDG